MRIRTVLSLLAVALMAGASHADTFWYTAGGGVPEVRSFDSATNTLGAKVIIPAPGTDPRVAPGYVFGNPWGIDDLKFAASAAPFVAYADDPYLVFVDTLPGSPTYNTIIQTLDLRQSPETSVGALFLKFHPSGTRVYVSCAGSASALPSVRIARQTAGLPAASLLYSFDPVGHPEDKLNNAATPAEPVPGEWSTMPAPPLLSVPAGSGVHVPYGIDVDPTGSKVYFAGHTEIGGPARNISNVYGFTIDAGGNYAANIVVTELPGNQFDHCFLLAFSPSTLPYSSGGSRCYVTNDTLPDVPGLMPAPGGSVAFPGFVMVVNTSSDSTTSRVEAGVIPPDYDPATLVPLTSLAPFENPVGVDFAVTSTLAYVGDRDDAFPAPATNGPIGVKVFATVTAPGLPAAPDKSFLYFADTNGAADATPRHFGVAVDNDDSEVVFCDSAKPAIDNYTVDGVLTMSVPATAGSVPHMICVQSGTGAAGSGGGGGGGGGSSSGATASNDNGAPFPSGKKKHKSRCGLTGIEAPILLGLWSLLRRRKSKNSK